MKRKMIACIMMIALVLCCIPANTAKAKKVIKMTEVVPVGGGTGRTDVTYERWKSSNPAVAEDSGTGWIVAKKVGTTVLTGKIDKGYANAGATVKLTLKVVKPYKIKFISQKATKDTVTYKIKNCMNKPLTIYTSRCRWGANDEWIGYYPYQSQSAKTITIQPNKTKSITLRMKKDASLKANSSKIQHMLGVKCNGAKFMYSFQKKGAYGEYVTSGWMQ